jgi:hypothetical protein
MSGVARALDGLREWNESPGEEDVRSAAPSSKLPADVTVESGC